MKNIFKKLLTLLLVFSFTMPLTVNAGLNDSTIPSYLEAEYSPEEPPHELLSDRSDVQPSIISIDHEENLYTPDVYYISTFETYLDFNYNSEQEAIELLEMLATFDTITTYVYANNTSSHADISPFSNQVARIDMRPSFGRRSNGVVFVTFVITVTSNRPFTYLSSVYGDVTFMSDMDFAHFPVHQRIVGPFTLTTVHEERFMRVNHNSWVIRVEADFTIRIGNGFPPARKSWGDNIWIV